MKITIDKKEIEVLSEDKNIVDVADRAKIGIPAPCYRANRKKGCCNACVIEIDSKQEFACVTKPQNGMDIVLNRPDLVELRKERLLEYKKNMKTATEDSGCGCGCGCASEKSEGCC